MGIEIYLLLALLAIALYAYAISAVAKFANRLGRTEVHTILAVILTPILPLLYLFCAGETDEHRKARIEQEEKWRIAISKAEQDAN